MLSSRAASEDVGKSLDSGQRMLTPQCAVKQLAANRANQALNEWMGNGRKGYDLICSISRIRRFAGQR